MVLSHLAEVDTKFYEAIAITPFVIIPGNNFDKGAVNNVGEFEIDDRRVAIAAIINRDKLFFGGIKNALEEWAGSGLFEEFVDFFDAGWALGNCCDVA